MIVDPVPNILYLWRNVIFGQLVAKAPLGLICLLNTGELGLNKKTTTKKTHSDVVNHFVLALTLRQCFKGVVQV